MIRFWTTAFLLAASAVFANAQVAEFGVAGGLSQIPQKELASGFALTMAGPWCSESPSITGNSSETNSGMRITAPDWYRSGRAGGMAIHQGFYNFLVYATREGKRVRPFATGGAHFANFVPPGATATYGQGDNQFGYNYGGG